MPTKTWTREEIEHMIDTNPRAVERAMVALLERQTADERQAPGARHHNRKGFSGHTARFGTYYARWVSSGRQLDGLHLEKARRIALHHVGQLTDFANGKR